MASRELQLMTPTQVDIFLTNYRKTGMMQRAAQAAGLSKHQIDKFAKGNTPEAEQFALNLEAAADEWSDVIREEISRRAITGVQKAIYYQGQFVDYETVYSDTLLAKMADANVKEYKKATEQATGGVQIQINTFSDKPPTVVIDELPSLE